MKIDELLDSRKFTYALAALTVLLATTTALTAAGVISIDMNQVSKQKAGEMVSNVIGNSSGSNYDVVKVEERSGLYAVDLTLQNQLRTVYVTKDAELFTTTMNSLSELRERVDLQRRTENCLNSKNVTLYGNISQRQTQLQIQTLGGTNRVDGYYRDVNQQGVLQEAVNNGVQALPAFYWNGEVLQGVNDLSAVRSFAQCSN